MKKVGDIEQDWGLLKKNWRRLIGVGMERLGRMWEAWKKDLEGSDRIYRRIGQDSGSEQNMEDWERLERIVKDHKILGRNEKDWGG